MKKCPKCGTPVKDEYLFCHLCAADLRIKTCIACHKELPEDALFCPWCGKNQQELPKAAVQPVSVPKVRPKAKQGGKEDLAEDMAVLFREPVTFSAEQKNFLQDWIMKLLNAWCGGTEKEIGWETSYSAWSNDDSWTEYSSFSAKPVRWSGERLQCLKPGLVEGEFSAHLKKIAENAGGEIWSASMPYYNRKVEKGFESVDSHDLMLIRDFCGIGVDVLFEYQSYDDRYAY